MKPFLTNKGFLEKTQIMLAQEDKTVTEEKNF